MFAEKIYNLEEKIFLIVNVVLSSYSLLAVICTDIGLSYSSYNLRLHSK